jgi:predicted MFS family arabinose efflux permease
MRPRLRLPPDPAGKGQSLTQRAIWTRLPPGVPLAFVCWFILNGIRGSFAVLYPTISAQPGWSAQELASTFSLGVLLYAPSTIAVGFLVDRIGIRSTMLGGCLLIAFSFGLIATATPDSAWRMLAGWAIAAGPAAAGIGYIPITKLLSIKAPSQLGRALGLAMIGQGLSPLLVGPALQSITEVQGWNVAVAAFAIFALVTLVPLIVNTAPTRPAPAAAHLPRFSVVGSISRPEFWLVFFGFFWLGYLLLIPTYLVAFLIVIGVAPYLAAVLAGVFGGLNSIGSIAAGWMTDRWGPLRVLGLGCVFLTVGTVALVDRLPGLYLLLGWYLLFAGIGRGIIGLTLAVAQTQAFAGAHFGRITGLLDVGFSTGAAAGVWLTAVGRDQLGSYAPSYLSTALASLLIVLLTALAMRRFEPTARSRPS